MWDRYNSHNTKERLSKLDAKKLTSLVPDKEQRKTVLNAVKGIASGQVSRRGACYEPYPAGE